jgi:hypothetical protein
MMFLLPLFKRAKGWSARARAIKVKGHGSRDHTDQLGERGRIWKRRNRQVAIERTLRDYGLLYHVFQVLAARFQY